MRSRVSLSVSFSLALFAMLAVAPMAIIAQDSDASDRSAASASPVAAEASDVADGTVVRGVFFFSPTCPHCERVITNDLPGMFETTGGPASLRFDETLAPEDVAFHLMSNGTLQLLMVDTTVESGGTMFVEDSQRLGLDRAGVPRLDIRDEYLMGDRDIPEQLPGIIRTGLAGGGIAWPPVPGIEAALASLGDAAVSASPSATADRDQDTVADLSVPTDDSPLDRIGRDPVGNGIAIIVLIALIASLVAVPVLAARGSLGSGPGWLVPLLVVIGIGVAAYLTNIESSGSEAVCGPVGDCNAVQQSHYAKLFGIPIGVLGVLGYLAIGALWAVARLGQGRAADWALVGIAAGTYGGMLFSVYLTFLEPFVIGATCMWCITSALIMLSLLWLSAGPAWSAFQRLQGDTPSASH